MHSLGYWEAWTLWWDGKKLDNYAMWSISMLWWARFGKLLQFAGGVVVVLDLIGPQRLRALGALIKRRRESIKSAEVAFLVLAPEGRSQSGSSSYAIRGWVLVPAGVIAVVPVIAYVQKQPILIVGIFTGILMWVFVTLLVVMLFPLMFLVVSKLVLLLAQLVLQSLASVLLGDRPGHPARWVSFVLVVFGFHLDLLGSS